MTMHFDKNGKAIHEGTKIRVWLEDSVEPEGGFWWYATVKPCLTDKLFVFQDGFNYEKSGELPESLDSIVYSYQDQIEVVEV